MMCSTTSSVQPWNEATPLVLEPGESRTIGFRFVLSDEIREVEATLAREQRPVAVGVPGYIVPTDMEAKLFRKKMP